MKYKTILYTILICILTFLFCCVTTIHILNNESFLESLYYISDSQIHGNGVFAAIAIKKDSDLGIIVIRKKQNMRMFRKYPNDRVFKDKKGILFKEHRDIGRFVNHSTNPNTKIIVNGDFCRLKTLVEIKEGEEITTDYTPFRIHYEGGYMEDVK